MLYGEKVLPKRKRKRPLDVRSMMDWSLLKTMMIPALIGVYLRKYTAGISINLLLIALFLFLNGLILATELIGGDWTMSLAGTALIATPFMLVGMFIGGKLCAAVGRGLTVLGVDQHQAKDRFLRRGRLHVLDGIRIDAIAHVSNGGLCPALLLRPFTRSPNRCIRTPPPSIPTMETREYTDRMVPDMPLSAMIAMKLGT